MKKSLTFILAVLCTLTAYVKADDVYPLFPTAKGWERTFHDKVYTPDDLWDYIDGAAESYLAQGFIDLHIAEYSKGKQNIRVEIYRHKDADHGFGIYSQERSPDLNFIRIGADGYLQGTVLNFLNGSFYVKMSASTDKKAVLDVMKDVALRLSGNIDPSPGLPDVLTRFPAEGRLPRQDAFISVSFMGHEFLNSVFRASYKADDTTFSMFILKEADPAGCEKILKQYLSFTGQPEDQAVQGTLLIKDPYNGDVEILWKDNLIFGITGTTDRALAEKYLGMMK